MLNVRFTILKDKADTAFQHCSVKAFQCSATLVPILLWCLLEVHVLPEWFTTYLYYDI